MKKMLTFLLFCCLGSVSGILAQDGWIKELPGPGNERSSDIIRSSDGHYVFLMSNTKGLGSGQGPGHYLVKVDIQGNILWTKKYASLIDSTLTTTSKTVLQKTSDHNFVIVKTVENDLGLIELFTIKLDTQGNTLWEQTTDLPPPYHISSVGTIIGTSDDGFAITGGKGSPDWVGKIIKLDANLTPEWVNYISINWNSRSITEYQGAIAITGKQGDVKKVDAAGNTVWSIKVPGLESFQSTIYSLPDGGYQIFEYYGGNPAQQARLDADGNVLWTKNILPPPYELIAGAEYIEMVSDGFIITMSIRNHTTSFPNAEWDLLLAKSDFEGNLVWAQYIEEGLVDENEYSTRCTGVVPTGDKGFMGTAYYFKLISSSPTLEYETGTFLFKTDSIGRLYSNQIIGKVAQDEQPNCELDSLETGLTGWFVAAEGATQTFFAATDSAGNYLLSVPTGQYTVSIHPPNNLWNPCDNDVSVDVISDSTTIVDFPMVAILDCPLLVISSSLFSARPCFDNNSYFVNYCNEGTISAEDAYVEIEVDSSLSYVSSSINLSSQIGNTYTFDLGDIEPGECSSFIVDFMVACDLPIGESVCIDAHIFPDSICIPDNSNWNGAFIEVSVVCEDSTVNFTLENVGTGDMLNQQDYIVVEDAILLLTGDYQLNIGEVENISIPATGATYTLIAEQVENAPGGPYAITAIEGCGLDDNGEISTGYINQFSLGNGIPYLDTDCTVASSSYDPNDKQGFPLGIYSQHFIHPNTDLEYMIRFQNTGTDTAFNIVIKDTLSPFLNVASFKAGTSSHPYEWQISDGNVLTFTFPNVLLPDSTVNEPGSNGFVKFKISQMLDLPLGTVIKNDAAIYFDYNPPIITNETFHTLGVEFIILSIQESVFENTRIIIRPNPVDDFAIFELEDKEVSDGLFELFDLSGKKVVQQKFSGNQFELNPYGLSSGFYFYSISEKGKVINAGKIAVR